MQNLYVTYLFIFIQNIFQFFGIGLNKNKFSNTSQTGIRLRSRLRMVRLRSRLGVVRLRSGIGVVRLRSGLGVVRLRSGLGVVRLRSRLNSF